MNFGAAGFMAAGAYTAIALRKATGLDLLPGIVAAAAGRRAARPRHRLPDAAAEGGLFLHRHALPLGGAADAGGELGLRRRLARRLYHPAAGPSTPFASYGEYLFIVMLVLAIGAVGIARTVENSRLGRGLQAIRDNERAAEAVGVPTLRLKLVATALCGALMAVAGAPLPYYSGYLEPGGGLQPGLCGERHRHAADRRRRHLGRAGDRRGAARRACSRRRR